VVMVTLHEATSLLYNANGFTDRRKGHHPNHTLFRMCVVKYIT